MPQFSVNSIERLKSCHHSLQQLFFAVILDYDCTVIEGYRSPQRQLELFNKKLSKVKYGKHNQVPSMAVDVAPYLPGRGIPWPAYGSDTYHKDINQFYHFAGFVEARARELNLNLRYGGDWDRDHNLSDQTFDDLVHFEIGGV